MGYPECGVTSNICLLFRARDMISCLKPEYRWPGQGYMLCLVNRTWVFDWDAYLKYPDWSGRRITGSHSGMVNRTMELFTSQTSLDLKAQSGGIPADKIRRVSELSRDTYKSPQMRGNPQVLSRICFVPTSYWIVRTTQVFTHEAYVAKPQAKQRKVWKIFLGSAITASPDVDGCVVLGHVS